MKKSLCYSVFATLCAKCFGISTAITQCINHCQYNCINNDIAPFTRYFFCHLQLTLHRLLFKRYSFFETIATVLLIKHSHDSQPKFMKWPLPQQPWPQQWPLNVTATKLIGWQNQQLPSPMPPEHGYISIYLIIQLTKSWKKQINQPVETY